MLAQRLDLSQINLPRRFTQSGQGLQRDIGGHVGVAIAVAADPGGVAQDRRQFRPVFVRIKAFERQLQVFINIDDHIEDDRANEINAEINFVRHLFFGSSHLPRLPKFFHFFRQVALQLAQFPREQDLDDLACLHHLRNMAQDNQNLLPFRFGWMGGKHQTQPRLLQQGPNFFGCFAALVQSLNRIDNRFTQGCPLLRAGELP